MMFILPNTMSASLISTSDTKIAEVAGDYVSKIAIKLIENRKAL